MMPVDVNSSKYISFNEEVGNHLKISKYKILLSKVRSNICC